MADNNDNMQAETLDALEIGAQATHQQQESVRDDTQQSRVDELGALRQESTETQATVEAQHFASIEQHAKDLTAIINQASQQQNGDRTVQESFLRDQRKQIEALQRQVEETISHLPDNKAGMVRSKLEELTRLAFEKQRRIESQHLADLEQNEADLQNLAADAFERQRILREEQTADIKREFSEILDTTIEKQEALKQDYRKLVEQERQGLHSLINDAHEKQKTLKKEHTIRQKDNRELVKRQMQMCHTLIKEGKRKEAYDIQVDVLKHLKEKQQNMESQQYSMTEANLDAFNTIKAQSEDSTKQLQAQNKEMFSQARELMDTQEQVHFDQMRQELVRTTKRDMKALEETMLEKHIELHADQQHVVQSVKEKLKKQLGDYHRRREEEQAIIISQTKQQISELEKRSQYSQEQLEKDQERIFATSEHELEGLGIEGERTQKQMAREQRDMLKAEYAETQKLIRVIETQKKEDERNQRQLNMDAKLQLGKELNQSQHETDELSRKVGNKGIHDVVEMGRNILIRLEECQEALQNLLRAEKRRIVELAEVLEEKQHALEHQHQKRLKTSDETMRSTVHKAEERLVELDREEKRLSFILDEANGTSQLMQDDALRQNHLELLELAKSARKKHEKVHDQQEVLIREAHKAQKEAVQASQQRLRKEQKALLKWHEEELAELQQDMKEKNLLLRQEQQLLMKQHENIKLHMKQEITDKQKKIKDEHTDKVSRAQHELRKLDTTFPDAPPDEEQPPAA